LYYTEQYARIEGSCEKSWLLRRDRGLWRRKPTLFPLGRPWGNSPDVSQRVAGRWQTNPASARGYAAETDASRARPAVEGSGASRRRIRFRSVGAPKWWLYSLYAGAAGLLVAVQ
jgi:hypothetical protein